MEYLLGIDLGCSACKVMLFDEYGNTVAYAHKELTSKNLKPGYVEQDANEWWEVTCANIKQVINESNINPNNIIGIGVTGEGPSLVCVDEDGRVLRPAMIHGDIRAFSLIKKFEEKFSKIFTYPIDLMFISELPVARLLWIKENEPEVFKKISGCMMSWDYIKYKLTGKITRLAELDTLCVTPCKLFDIPIEWFGRAYPNAYDIAGFVTEKAAKQTGLTENIPVVVSTYDNPCNSLGAGLTENGYALDQAGATEIINIAVNKPPKISFVMKHLIPGLWIVGTSPFRGIILQWFAENFILGEAEKKGIAPYKLLDLWAEVIEPGSNGLIFLPYLAGERATFYDPNARGVFFGITLKHTKKHFARAVLEGIAFSLRQTLENFQAFGVEIKELRLGGGGAKSIIWNKIKADILGRTLSTLKVYETGCLGAAILASVGVKKYSNLKEAADTMVKISEKIEFNTKNHERYNVYYDVYKKLYPQLRELFNKLTQKNIA